MLFRLSHRNAKRFIHPRTLLLENLHRGNECLSFLLSIKKFVDLDHNPNIVLLFHGQFFPAYCQRGSLLPVPLSCIQNVCWITFLAFENICNFVATENLFGVEQLYYFSIDICSCHCLFFPLNGFLRLQYIFCLFVYFHFIWILSTNQWLSKPIISFRCTVNRMLLLIFLKQNCWILYILNFYLYVQYICLTQTHLSWF